MSMYIGIHLHCIYFSSSSYSSLEHEITWSINMKKRNEDNKVAQPFMVDGGSVK